MRLPDVYRMSEDGVYQSNIPSCLSDGCRFQVTVPDSILGVKVARCSIGMVLVWSNWSKSGLQEYRIRPEVRD